MVEGQRCDAARRHEIPHLESHLREVVICQRVLVLLVFEPENRVVILGSTVRLARGDADADHGCRLEPFPIGSRIEEVLEQFAMQITEVIGDRELGCGLIGSRQPHAEIEIADEGREIVPHDPGVTFSGLSVDDLDIQDFEQGELLFPAASGEVKSSGDDVEFEDIAIPVGIVPGREFVEAAMDDAQSSAEVLPTVLAPGEVGEVRRRSGALRWRVVLVESSRGDAE